MRTTTVGFHRARNFLGSAFPRYWKIAGGAGLMTDAAGVTARALADGMPGGIPGAFGLGAFGMGQGGAFS